MANDPSTSATFDEFGNPIAQAPAPVVNQSAYPAEATLPIIDPYAASTPAPSAAPAPKTKSVTVGADAGGDYPTSGTTVNVPVGNTNFQAPSSVTNSSVFQDVNSHSGGALGDLYNSINSGSYTVQNGTLITGSEIGRAHV